MTYQSGGFDILFQKSLFSSLLPGHLIVNYEGHDDNAIAVLEVTENGGVILSEPGINGTIIPNSIGLVIWSDISEAVVDINGKSVTYFSNPYEVIELGAKECVSLYKNLFNRENWEAGEEEILYKHKDKLLTLCAIWAGKSQARSLSEMMIASLRLTEKLSIEEQSSLLVRSIMSAEENEIPLTDMSLWMQICELSRKICPDYVGVAVKVDSSKCLMCPKEGCSLRKKEPCHLPAFRSGKTFLDS